jgi:hypothetical protein
LPADQHGPNVRDLASPFLTLGVSDPRTFAETTVTPNFGPDRVHSWSFGIQRELGPHAALEARYVGNKGQNLFQSINQNPYLGCGDTSSDPALNCINPLTGAKERKGLTDAIAAGVFPANLLPAGLTPCPAANTGGNGSNPSAVGRANCDLGRVRERTNTAYSDYNGLQTEFRTNNLFKQLTMKTNYTWSKTTDNASEIFGTFAGGGTYAFAQDPLNFKGAEHSLSGLDFRHTWTVSFYEDIPVFRSQHGFAGHALGGWAVAGSYILQTGQNYTPVQAVLNRATGGFNSFDRDFNSAFNSGLETARPFVGNSSAPPNAIGIFAADACNFFGAGCTLAPDQLVNFTILNTVGGVLPVDSKQVHFIANGKEADALFGTPFGNAGRNSLRGDKLNTVNLEFSKNVKLGERVSVTWHMSMVNAFNHPNFGFTGPGSITDVTIDPFLEDAGLNFQGTGFADTSVLDGGHRTIRFGLKIKF